MQVLTSLILAAFVGYAGSWYLGMVEGNFALLLFLATLVTGIYWFAERFYFLPQRQKAADLLESQAEKRRAEAGSPEQRAGVSRRASVAVYRLVIGGRV